MKVLSLGSICLDVLIKNINELPAPNHVTQVDNIKILAGGGALNSAIAMKRLGIDVHTMGELGKDYAGDLLLNIMQEESVNSGLILRKTDKPSSIVNVLINQNGERSFICNPGNFINIKLSDYNWELLKDFKILLIGSCFLLDGLLPDLPELLQLCREYNTTTIIDTVWPTRTTYKLINKSLPYMDFFTPSFEEAQVISEQKTPEDIAKWCLDQGTKNVIIKMDKQGCYLANENIQIQVPALKVNLIDSTGAGDCFLAGLVKGLLNNYDLIKATQMANAAGAMCVQSLGAYTGITNYNDLYNNLFSKYSSQTSLSLQNI